MKKFVNEVDRLIPQSLAGFVAAHESLVSLGGEGKFIRRKNLRKGKVALVSGGGSGHEPLHAGFIGHGMLDAACPGQVFTSPTPDQMFEAATAVDTGSGVIFIVKNYEGDVMNFDMAAEICDSVIEKIIIDDDVAVERSIWSTGRRGVAGTLVVEKIVGAAAEAGASLQTCLELGRRVNATTRSIGVALSSCTVPAAGKPTFDISDSELEFGVGIHGEPGRRRSPMKKATDIAEEMADSISADLGATRGKALLLVNGFGGTPLIELYLMYVELRQHFERSGFEISRSLVGNYVTSLEMAGCSATLTLLDDHLISLWDAPVNTPSLRWGM